MDAEQGFEVSNVGHDGYVSGQGVSEADKAWEVGGQQLDPKGPIENFDSAFILRFPVQLVEFKNRFEFASSDQRSPFIHPTHHIHHGTGSEQRRQGRQDKVDRGHEAKGWTYEEGKDGDCTKERSTHPGEEAEEGEAVF